MLQQRTQLTALLTLLTCSAAVGEELAIGKPAPKFTVTAPGGKEHKLADYAGKKNVVVLFSRAHW